MIEQPKLPLKITQSEWIQALIKTRADLDYAQGRLALIAAQAYRNGVPIEQILKCTRWRSRSTFYRRILRWQEHLDNPGIGG